MDILTVILAIIKSLLAFFAGSVLAIRFPIIKYILPYTGRLNRIQFAIYYLPFLIFLTILYGTIDTLILSSIVLPSYWLWKGMFWLVTILSTPFYISLSGRRFRDMGIPLSIGFLFAFTNIFCTVYAVLPHMKFLTTLFLGAVLLFLLFMPGIPESRAQQSIRFPKK